MKVWSMVATVVLAVAAVGAGAALGTGGGKDAAAPDVILHDGRITTLDDSSPTVPAPATRDGEIVASGTDDDVEGLVGTRRG